MKDSISSGLNDTSLVLYRTGYENGSSLPPVVEGFPGISIIFKNSVLGLNRSTSSNILRKTYCKQTFHKVYI